MTPTYLTFSLSNTERFLCRAALEVRSPVEYFKMQCELLLRVLHKHLLFCFHTSVTLSLQECVRSVCSQVHFGIQNSSFYQLPSECAGKGIMSGCNLAFSRTHSHVVKVFLRERPSDTEQPIISFWLIRTSYLCFKNSKTVFQGCWHSLCLTHSFFFIPDLK